MTESGFEARLARGLREMAEGGTRPFDPRAVAEAVVAAPRGVAGSGRWLLTREMRRLIALAAAALLLAALLGLAVGFVGSRPPATERLAFIRNGDIWVAYADGREARLLVAHSVEGTESRDYEGIQWSPDGSRLAAAIGSNGYDNSPRISIFTADGALLGSFDFVVGAIRAPPMAWSPDGNHLAVLAPEAPDGGLWLLDGEGSLEQALELPLAYRADMPMKYFSISWSPDGRSLAVTGCPCNSQNNGGWILAVDGSDAHEVAFSGVGKVLSLAWSPDGTRLAVGSSNWTGADPAGPGEIWVMDVDGGSAERLATEGSLAVGPLAALNWSPDGTLIAYVGPTADSQGRPQPRAALNLASADGSGEPVRVGFIKGPMVWSSELVRPFYMPHPEDNGSGVSSIVVGDPRGGPSRVVIDRVDMDAQFDLN